MAGHSEWSNKKYRKRRQDRKKAKKFASLVKEITSEARKNPDPEENPTLASAIERAKEANMPKENIEKAIKRATGELESANYQRLIYEGYGPYGLAVLVQVETENKNRTSTELKNIFSRHGGELGENGCVKWMFDRKGEIEIDKANLNGTDSEQIQLEAIEKGAENIRENGEKIVIYCKPNDLKRLTEFLDKYCKKTDSRLTMIPANQVSWSGEKKEEALQLIEELKEERDVEKVFTTLK